MRVRLPYTGIWGHVIICSAMAISPICWMRLFPDLAPLFTCRFRSGLGNKLVRPIRVRHTIAIDCEELMSVYEYLLSYLMCLTPASDARVALLIVIARVHYTGTWYQCNKQQWSSRVGKCFTAWSCDFHHHYYYYTTYYSSKSSQKPYNNQHQSAAKSSPKSSNTR